MDVEWFRSSNKINQFNFMHETIYSGTEKKIISQIKHFVILWHNKISSISQLIQICEATGLKHYKI